MWSLRRAALPIKKHGVCRVFSAILNVASHDGHRAAMCNDPQFYSLCEKFSIGSHNLCSLAGAQGGSEKDELNDGFWEKETNACANMVGKSNAADEKLISEADEEVLETESVAGGGEKSPAQQLLNILRKTLVGSIRSVVNKWVEDGNPFSQAEASYVIVGLRNRRTNFQALEVAELLEEDEQIVLAESDYATRLDLITKVKGLSAGEKYLEKIPECFKGELVYRTLLTEYVFACNRKKAEATFDKMRELKLPITVPACNQMLLLYKRLDIRKIPEILSLMEKEKLRPSRFTYKLLIDTRGGCNDIEGMERVFETMKADGIEPDYGVLSLIARYYIYGGRKDKAETMLKEIEEGNQKTSIGARIELLRLYASLGKPDEVSKIWKECEVNPAMNESRAAIEAWGTLGKVKEAEAVFDKMLKKWKKVSSKHYSTMLEVYVKLKLVNKGMEFINQMGNRGDLRGPLILDALVKLYLEAGDLDKADSILTNKRRKLCSRPLFRTFISVMSQYAKRGDVHNTEKLFFVMKQHGYPERVKPFHVLINAYINAKVPAYGFWERIKADNVFPSKAFAKRIEEANPFRSNVVEDMLS